VRVKKAQPAARSMRYLLSVDRSLGRISLKRIPLRVKKTASNRVRSSSANQDASRQTTRSRNGEAVASGWSSSQTIVLALIGIAGAATLIGLPGLVERSESTNARPATSASQPAPPPAPPLTTTKAATVPVASVVGAARTRATDMSSVNSRPAESQRAPAVDSAPRAAATAHAASTPLPAVSKPNVEPKAHAEPTTPADIKNEGAVTIGGCLQAGDGSFWLKDTSGEDAPKSRSWKSGFLKKRTGSVQIANYVGQRVTATGTFANRTLQARSVERVAASCN
jgi:hypothetical protein